MIIHRYTERLVETEKEVLVEIFVSAYDNALVETLNGLYKNRSYQETKSLEELCRSRVCHARMGASVQQCQAIRTDWKHFYCGI